MTDDTNRLVNPEVSTATDLRLEAGRQGRCFEDFEVGNISKHPYGRTVTETDTVRVTNLTMNLNRMHFTEYYAAQTEFRQGDELVFSLQRTPMVLKREYADTTGKQSTGWPTDIGTQPEELE